MSSRLIPLFAALAFGSAALTGCGSDGTSTEKAAAAPSASATSAAAPLTFENAWVKAAEKGMTAAFGTLVNTTGADVTVVSAATPASPMVELHEVAGTGGQARMKEKDGGFVVPAGGELELKPGGYHIMLMGLKQKLEPGGEVTLTLTLKDGTKTDVTAVVKSFQGGNETYAPGH
ncbi:copper chaperone PCu(A)C [Actinocorallia populi]|uniref:copper chaperone PCu(A)C n=1 Tax=Actinocorallia populi TaxID=2079200 RepID=UPI000D08802F|nr:copper chaperone PCu(A)C [Actinocorallia populi]